MTLYAAADSTDIQPLSHAAVPRAGILRSKRGQCQTICKHRGARSPRETARLNRRSSGPSRSAMRRRTRRRWTPPSPGRSFEGVLDFLVSAPEGLVEEADPELDAERPRALVGVVEVLV